MSIANASVRVMKLGRFGVHTQRRHQIARVERPSCPSAYVEDVNGPSSLVDREEDSVHVGVRP